MVAVDFVDNVAVVAVAVVVAVVAVAVVVVVAPLKAFSIGGQIGG